MKRILTNAGNSIMLAGETMLCFPPIPRSLLLSAYVNDPTQAFLPGSSLRAGRQFTIRKNIATLATLIGVKLKYQQAQKFEAKDNITMCEITE